MKQIKQQLWDRIKEDKYYLLITVTLLILYQIGIGVFPAKKALLVVGVFTSSCILFIPYRRIDKNKKKSVIDLLFQIEIHNYICVVILLFGLLFAYFAPVYGSPDENVHGARAIHLAEGHLFIDTNRTASINGIQSIYTEGVDNGKNLYISQLFDEPFERENEDTIMVNGAKSFPFLSYLPQALGILIGDILGVNAGIVFLLGRVVNLICYALLVRLAIKIAPAYKVFVGAIGLFPMSVYLGASYNPEATVTGVGLITIAYFIQLCYKKEREIGYKQIGIYTVLCSLMAVVKLPYALLIGLLLFLPKKQFEHKRCSLSRIGAIVICGVVALSWLLYTMHIPDYVHEEYLVSNGVDTMGQLKYFLANTVYSIKVILYSALIYTDNLMRECFTFGWLSHTLPILSVFYILFMGGNSLYYPKDKNITNSIRIGVGLVAVGIYVTIFAIQFLNWTPIGAGSVVGVQGRYFVLVLALLPMVFGIHWGEEIDKEAIDKRIVVTALVFLALAILGFFAYF